MREVDGATSFIQSAEMFFAVFTPFRPGPKPFETLIAVFGSQVARQRGKEFFPAASVYVTSDLK
jgi:hypothetical protein